MNRLTLKYEPDLDFVLIAVTSSLKDYLLCFKINRALSIDFVRISELSLELTSSGEPSYFSRYHYRIPETETDFFLLANKGTEGYLIPEMKQTDYFILIKNYLDEEDTDNFMEGLNRIPEIVVAAEVNPGKLKSKENLVF
ncbi:IPExxxVDY family protein [Pararcticibacter amylolyticus]|uniref:IPExxxVDY family protein n=1 Tax=Pararcticibacter amylolyticus TaxID=2173175 RepID=A0A2U2PMN9_9SPHI|nr:IPExxxVDY family protein [Pararcticibacter amylolyticus]PWG82661.1 IPExxxVDY family protein [Pararcticibacter amylolyticus]